jgi:signal transduction histidine kinase
MDATDARRVASDARRVASDARRVVAAFLTDTTNPPAPRHPRLRRGRLDLVVVIDWITAFGCFLAANQWLTTHSIRHHTPLGMGTALLTAFVTSAPLVLRTRLPLPSLGATALTIIGTAVLVRPHLMAADAFLPTSVLVYFLCLYAVTVRCKLRIVVAAYLFTWVGAGFVHFGLVAAAFFLSLIPLVIGASALRLRNSERRLAERLAEQERRHSSERALFEERQRIARELHDVVAHHMSVIAIQAEAAPYKTPDPPPELVESFAGIRVSALTGLTELRRVLGVLRTDRPDTGPQPGLADLDALLDSARSGGLTVAAVTSGHPVALPEGVDLSAYRVLQEALSNAMRHAPGSHVQVALIYRASQLELDIRNDAGRSTGRGKDAVRSGETGENGGMDRVGSGHGLIGMRERAAMLRGTLNAAPTSDGGFRVHAILPLSTDDNRRSDEALGDRHRA